MEAQSQLQTQTHKVVIAHRGASGYLPEHTLEGKALAHHMGVDYLEQDLAMTKDGVLVVVHDHFLDRITDVREIFPERHRADGRYYVIDFTLEEIRSLCMSEGFELAADGSYQQLYPQRFPMFKSRFAIHTFAEEIEFIQGLNATLGREAGLYPETKAPWLHTQEGFDISKATLQVLRSYGYTSKDSKVIFQTFDYPNLKYAKTELMPALDMDLTSILLLTDTTANETMEFVDGKWRNFDFDAFLAPENIAKNFQELDHYADGIGPDYHMLIDQEHSSVGNIVLTDMVKIAHDHGLFVHPYTARKDALPPYVRTLDELYEILYCKLGVDGLFTDFPDLGVDFVQRHCNAEC